MSATTQFCNGVNCHVAPMAQRDEVVSCVVQPVAVEMVSDHPACLAANRTLGKVQQFSIVLYQMSFFVQPVAIPIASDAYALRFVSAFEAACLVWAVLKDFATYRAGFRRPSSAPVRVSRPAFILQSQAFGGGSATSYATTVRRAVCSVSVARPASDLTGVTLERSSANHTRKVHEFAAARARRDDSIEFRHRVII